MIYFNIKAFISFFTFVQLQFKMIDGIFSPHTFTYFAQKAHLLEI